MALSTGVILLVLCIPFGTAIPLSSFYPYGSVANDSLVIRGLDVSSDETLLPTPFPFFGSRYTTVFVSLYVMCDEAVPVCVHQIRTYVRVKCIDSVSHRTNVHSNAYPATTILSKVLYLFLCSHQSFVQHTVLEEEVFT